MPSSSVNVSLGDRSSEPGVRALTVSLRSTQIDRISDDRMGELNAIAFPIDQQPDRTECFVVGITANP